MWCLVRGSPSCATSSEFVKQKNVHFVIGFGGGFDQHRRLKITAAAGTTVEEKTTAVSAAEDWNRNESRRHRLGWFGTHYYCGE